MIEAVKIIVGFGVGFAIGFCIVAAMLIVFNSLTGG